MASHRSFSYLFALVPFALSACTKATPDYCDATHPCITPGAVCNLQTKTCVVESSDGGVDAGPRPAYVWSKTFTGGDVSEVHVAVDGQGTVYLGGTFARTIEVGNATLKTQGPSDDNVFFASFDPGGAFRFAQSHGGEYAERAAAVAVDAADRPFLLGTFTGRLALAAGVSADAAGVADVFVARFDAQGAPRAIDQLGGEKEDRAGGLVLDDSGNAIVAGSYHVSLRFMGEVLPSAGFADVVVARFGVGHFALHFGGTGRDNATALARDAQGNLYVAGTFEGSASFGGASLDAKGQTDIFVASFDSTGKHRFSFGLGSASPDTVAALAVAGSTLCLAGSFQDSLVLDAKTTLVSAGGADAFVSCYDAASSALRFGLAFGGPSLDEARALALDSAANIYLTGSFVRPRARRAESRSWSAPAPGTSSCSAWTPPASRALRAATVDRATTRVPASPWGPLASSM